MRTTIDLPEELFREAKLRAVQEGSTLKELVTECIRSGLQRPASTKRELSTRRKAPFVAIRKTPDLAPIPERSNRQLNAILENEEVEAVRKLATQRDARP
jgi:hypothetical protein